MLRAIQGIATLLVVVALAAAAVAIATGGGGPQHDQPTATITFAHAKLQFRECDGQDGFFVEQRSELTGTSTGDPRLTGDVRVEILEIFSDAGPQEGRLTISDPETGSIKADAKFDNTGPLSFTQGVLSGRVRDAGSGDEEQQGDGALVANWRIVYGGNGSVTGQIGGEADDATLPTSLWSGSCRGQFEETEFDIPAPDAVTTLATAGGRTFGR